MKADIHSNYREAEIRCACGNVIKTRSVKPVIIIGICNAVGVASIRLSDPTSAEGIRSRP